MKMTKMSSRGQIVIPQNIRKSINASEGSIFAVIGEKNSIILKKIPMPSKEDLIKELKKISLNGKKIADKKGIKERDIPKIVERIRRGE